MATKIDTSMMSVVTENLAVSAASVQSAAATTTGDTGLCFVRISVTQNTYVDLNAATASATTSENWPAGTVEYRVVPTGQRIAFIRDTTDGRITITRMA
jgi:hypothetical protein